jgi:hypothetical protein
MMLPAPPPDGGFLVLNDAQISNLDIVCAIKTRYPRTKIYAQRTLAGDVRGLSREARRVMSIGNPIAGPTGMVGYFARQADLTLRGIRSALDKAKAASR